jgi:glutamate racemase
MDNRDIGIFDSGLGGLTAVREIMNRLPLENIIYFGDTGRVPYGTRSKETITGFVEDDIAFLTGFNVKLILSACGTASTVALPGIAGNIPLPVIGVLEPAAKQAAQVSKTGRIGVLGTQGTVASKKFTEAVLRLNPAAEIIEKACPMFVPIVENGYAKSEVARIIAEEYLLELKMAKVDTIILGCTHYPLLKEIIGGIMGDKVFLVDSGAAAAVAVLEYLRDNNGLSEKAGDEQYKFFVSDSPDQFARLGSLFLQKDLGYNVHKVSVGK